MWLSGLHIPESYITALVQSTCRKNGWPLDKSTLYTTVLDVISGEEVEERPESGNCKNSLNNKFFRMPTVNIISSVLSY